MENYRKGSNFFEKNGFCLTGKNSKNWITQKINTLAMIAPITNEEKQSLLETVSLENKINTLGNIISFYLHESGYNTQTIQ